MKKIILGTTYNSVFFLNETTPIEFVVDFNLFTPGEMQEHFYGIFGETAVNEMLENKTIDSSGNVSDGTYINGTLVKTENSFMYYKMLKYKFYIDGELLFDGYKKVQEITFSQVGNLDFKAELYNVNGGLIKTFSFNNFCKELVKDVKTLNINNHRVINFDEFDLYLSVGRTPYILQVDKIINKLQDEVYEIYIEKETGGFEVLGIGTELNFGISGTNSIEENKVFVFRINKIFTAIKNEKAIGVIRIQPLAENINVSNKQFYNLKGIINNKSNSVKISNFKKEKNLITKRFNGKPLFYYFVCKGVLTTEPTVINGKGEVQNIVIDKKDEETRIIYFNPLYGQNYFYKKNSYVVPIKYKENLIPHNEIVNVVSNSVIFKTPKFLDFISIKPERVGMENLVIEYQTEQNKIIVLKGVNNIASGTDDLTTAIGSKHIAINDKVKYIKINEEIEKVIDGITVKVISDTVDNFILGNHFLEFSFGEDTITMLKNTEDKVYYANKVIDRNKNVIMGNIMQLYKKYALEDGKLVEYDDGYIELEPFYMDHIFKDLDDFKREISSMKVFAINVSAENEGQISLAGLYADSFKTGGLVMKTFDRSDS